MDAIVVTDEYGIITHFNNAAGKIFRCSLVDVVGLNVTTLMREEVSVILPVLSAAVWSGVTQGGASACRTPASTTPTSLATVRRGRSM